MSEGNDQVKTRPVKRFRSGRITVAQFDNEFHNDEGTRISHMYSPQKSYKQGEEWKTSNSYSLKDLIHLRGIIDQIVQTAYKVTETVVAETPDAEIAEEVVEVEDAQK